MVRWIRESTSSGGGIGFQDANQLSDYSYRSPAFTVKRS